jgi:hypothetical protein
MAVKQAASDSAGLQRSPVCILTGAAAAAAICELPYQSAERRDMIETAQTGVLKQTLLPQPKVDAIHTTTHSTLLVRAD